jgi:hypothetical protein
MKIMRALTRTSLVLVATLALAACGSKTEETATDLREDIVTEMPEEGNVVVNIADSAPPPLPAPVNVTEAAAPPPAFTDSQQMRDDADATGLTSRLPTDGGSGAGANETQPVQ